MNNNNKSADHVAWKGEWQTSVPDGLLHSAMSGLAKFLWICLKSYASKTSPNPFPGRHTLCQMLDVGISAFKKYRRELEQNGWLQREDKRHENGDFGGSIYTLMVPQNCKQNKPRGVEKRSPIKRSPIKWSPINQPPKDHQSEENQIKRNTTTNGAANAAKDSSGFSASQPGATPPGPPPNGREHELAQSFIKRWNDTFQKWYGVAYQEAYGDVVQVQKLFQTFPEARPRDFLYLVFQMWLDTREKDGIVEKDPLFYSYKGQRNLNFFCRHVLRIAEEQDDTIENVIGRITAKELESLEEAVVAGRN